MEYEDSQEARDGQMSAVTEIILPVENIDIPYRLRPLNEDAVVGIMESMRKVGQISPIMVRSMEDGKRIDLVAGRHRLEAAKRLGWSEINARVFDCDDIEARKLEIAENLHRAELTVLERAEHVAEWIRLTKAEKGLQVENPLGGRQPHDLGISEAVKAGVVGDLARGSRSLKIDSLTDEAKAAAVAAGLDGNQSALLKVASYADDDQVEAVAAIVAEKAKVKAKPVTIEGECVDVTPRESERPDVNCAIADLLLTRLSSDDIEIITEMLGECEVRRVIRALRQRGEYLKRPPSTSKADRYFAEQEKRLSAKPAPMVEKQKDRIATNADLTQTIKATVEAFNVEAQAAPEPRGKISPPPVGADYFPAAEAAGEAA